MVTHDPHAAHFATHVRYIDKGELVAETAQTPEDWKPITRTMSARLAILYEHPEWFRPAVCRTAAGAASRYEEWRADKLVFSLEETANSPTWC